MGKPTSAFNMASIGAVYKQYEGTPGVRQKEHFSWLLPSRTSLDKAGCLGRETQWSPSTPQTVGCSHPSGHSILQTTAGHLPSRAQTWLERLDTAVPVGWLLVLQDQSVGGKRRESVIVNQVMQLASWSPVF